MNACNELQLTGVVFLFPHFTLSLLILQKPKLGCLDKSQLDWNSYVKENNIREELSTHNKGKDGYVEKLEFLERADLRQFEQEKALREKTRKSLMK